MLAPKRGLMKPEFEALLSAEPVDAVAAPSAPVCRDWRFMVSAVQKVATATATATTTGGGGPAWRVAERPAS